LDPIEIPLGSVCLEGLKNLEASLEIGGKARRVVLRQPAADRRQGARTAAGDAVTQVMQS
jgi:hypothetical protein